MANDLNAVSLVGRLTRDPDLRSLPSGASVCELRLAYNTSVKRGDAWEDKGNFINVTVWGAQGEALARNLTRGQRVGVTGRLEWREWETQDGGKREQTSITASQVQYLDPKPDGAPAARPAAQPAAAQAPAPLPPADDVPF